MSEEDIDVVCSKIEEEREFLHDVSQDIWEHPELGHQEVRAHTTLTSALMKHGFHVEENYFLPTAFRATVSSGEDGGPTIAVMLEYDALPNIGHACGHNLIAEAGLAAALGVKAAMEADPSLKGKLLVLGTPAEENAGGKILLMEKGALEGVDAAMMVHPARHTRIFCNMLSSMNGSVNFIGQETHASAFPWQGRNALDAAVSAYNNIAMLRQQVKPHCRIHVIITKGGTVANIIPGEARIEFAIRASTSTEMLELYERVKCCVEAGAKAAGCSFELQGDTSMRYYNMLSNKVISEIFRGFGERFGLRDSFGDFPTGSTDMGNVSHFLPSIHPIFGLPTDAPNHSRAFTDAAGAPSAQDPTLAASKAMALTALALMRRPEALSEAKKEQVEESGKY